MARPLAKEPLRTPYVPRKKTSIPLRIVLALLYVVWVTFVVMTPVLGAWISSSLAAYAGGNTYVAAASGLLLFPILPLLWEGISLWRRRRRNITLPHILTFGDRLLLRTIFLNLLFLGAVFGARPEPTCRALAARGDWMLDGMPDAHRARDLLFTAADRISFLYELVRDNPYDGSDASAGDTGKSPPPLPRGDEMREGDDTSDSDKTNDDKPPSDDGPPKPGNLDLDPGNPWPMARVVHPAAAAAPKEAEASVEALGGYFKGAEPNELARLKALHDWVAVNVAYDGNALKTKEFPPQTADAVLSSRRGVCEGYARLLVALGEKAGVDIRYVIGDAKGAGGEVDGAGHAWNVATVGGKRYLVDATWDAGTLDDAFVFKAGYRTEYLMTPPEVFIGDHFPREEGDQLLEHPIDRGAFMRRPQLRPDFFVAGLTLESPDRSQVTVSGAFDIRVKASKPSTFLLASYEPKAGGESKRCVVDGQGTFDIRCSFDAPGPYRVLMFANDQRYGSYKFVGELQAISRD